MTKKTEGAAEAAAEKPRQSLAAILKDVIESSALWNHEKVPFQAKLHPGYERLVFLAGPNATGKSLLARITQSIGREHFGTTPINISMTERTGSGLSEISGMRRMFMFGDESEQSTGATSASTALRGLDNAKSYAENDGKHALLVLDEPEIGLSEGYEYALGLLIGQKTLELPEKACGVLVVSHSKTLVEGLRQSLGQDPTFVFTGKQDLTLDGWMSHKERFTPEELLELNKQGHETWRAVAQAEQSFKKAS